MILVKRTALPLSKDIIHRMARECGISDLSAASIREIARITRLLEKEAGFPFVHLEIGSPGLAPPEVGTQAEIAALKKGVASQYPLIDGLPELKQEISRFARLYLNVAVTPESCFPTVGSMQGSFAAFMVSCRRDIRKDTTLFLDPGFPVQKQQHQNLGLKYERFDVYDWRGEKLERKLSEYLEKGNISTLVYSSPNNPSWICFTKKELEIIGRLAIAHDAIVLEDLAYFGMDFRANYSTPGQAPYQPTVAEFTDNWVLLISSSKAFSYAGQRISALLMSDTLRTRRFPDLKRFFSSDEFGQALVYGALYSTTSGTAHSAQYALLAMLGAANNARFNFIEAVREYGVRAEKAKALFLSNGFKMVYDKDEERELAHGFYFTVSYPGLSSSELLFRLLQCGISAISLCITGSSRTEGIRICVSKLCPETLGELEQRLKRLPTLV